MAARKAAPLLQWNVGDHVNSVAISNDSLSIASGSDDNLVHIWDVRTGALVLGPLKGHTGLVWSVAWAYDDSLIASGSDDGTIRVWDVRTGALIVDPLKGHGNSVLSVAFSPDNTCLASGSKDNSVRIWDVRTGISIGDPLRGHIHWVWSVAFSPSGTCIISGSADSTIRIWNADTGAPVGWMIRGHTDSVLSVAFSPDSSRIVSGSRDNTIRIWDAHTGASVGHPFRAHTNMVWSVGFSPDSTRIISGSADSTIRIWDARTGAPINEAIRGHTEKVWSVVFSPDGTRVVSSSQDKTICVWGIPLLTSSIGTANTSIDTYSFNNVADDIIPPLSGPLNNATRDIPSFDMVTSNMSVQEMFACLVRHGCSDLTSSADINQSSAVITSGGFGDVRRLVMDNGTVVAIKTLRLHVLRRDDEKAMKRAVREVYVWSRLCNVNVQQLLGIIVFQGGLGMVSPWMEKGNLQQYITAHPDVERYPLCIQVSSGVSYLHSVGIVHGDLKTNNILVSDDGTLKINDFDYAILPDTSLQFSAITRPGGGTLRWMAPELLQPEEDGDEGAARVPTLRSQETDVYALGMTMLEILTGNVPYAEYRSDMGIYRAIHTQTPPKHPKELHIPEEIANPIWKLLLRCWDHDPSARPDAASVLAELKIFAVQSNFGS